MSTIHSAIERACASLGSQAALAEILGVTPGAVNQWVASHRPIPVERCPDIERVTAGAASCEELRQDVSWVRVPDATWPHPKGRPLVDHAAKVGAGDTAKEHA